VAFREMRLLAGRVAIVTGATSGIGRAIALLFASQGAYVVVADKEERPSDRSASTCELIADDGGTATFVPTDLAKSSQLEHLVERTVAAQGRIDILVNNAATYIGKPLLETTEAEWDHVFAVNLKAVFILSKLAVATMLTQAPQDGVRGRIVNISSQHGMVAAPGDISYGTSKSGVVYITRQVAADYGSRGVICNAVAPGKIVTGTSSEDYDEDRMRSALSRTPLGRLGQPVDVARAALFLASDYATFISGTNLMVDGGWTAS
jgi:NAD(P)-dependent dehydrogenase (short-subunit alcohol dehydrogenase family)